jgi:hypothetical protein
MKKLLFLILISIAFSRIPAAGAVSLILSPASQTVIGGQPASVDVGISGIGHPPSVGAFDLSVSFDPALLLPTDVSFGALLGDPGASPPEALTDFMFTPGVVEFAEVSLLSPAELDALQTSAFSLGTVSFTALGSGTVSVSFSAGVVDDAFGNKLALIPEPSTLLLLVTGVLSVLAFGFRRAAASERFCDVYDQQPALELRAGADGATNLPREARALRNPGYRARSTKR